MYKTLTVREMENTIYTTFDDKLNELAKEGWKPVGGINLVIDKPYNNNVIYYIKTVLLFKEA